MAEVRPGMPDIQPSGDPQPFNINQNQGASAPTNSGAAAFAAQFLAGMNGQPQTDPAQPPVQPQPAIPQQAVWPAQNGPAMVTPQQKSPEVQVTPVIDRFSAAPTPDPLSELNPIQAPAPLEDVPAPQDMGEKAGHAFAALKAKMKEERKRAEEYLGKYNALVESTKGFVDEKAKFTDALNAKDKELAQLQEDIGKLELSRSPAFQEKFDAPLNDMCGSIASVLEQNGVTKEDAWQKAYGLITADPADMADAIASLPTLAQGEIGIQARNARKLLADRDAELAEWRKSQIGLEEVASRENDVRYAQHMSEMADRAVEIVKSLTPDAGQVPAYAVTDPEFAAERDQKEQQFKEWLVRAPEEQRVSAMFEGFMAPKTYEMLQQTMLENLQLKQALSNRLGAASPRVTAVPPSAPPPPPPPPPPPENAAFAPAGAATDAVSFASEFFRKSMGQ